MNTYTLGISAYYHDAAAALLRDDEIVAAAQQERFTRRKYDPRYPKDAIQFCLEFAGIDSTAIETVAFYEQPGQKFDRLLETHRAVSPAGFDSLRLALSVWVPGRLDLARSIRGLLGPGFRGNVRFVDHHASHAASAFYPSPFEEAAVLTLDAVGEWTTSSVGVGRGHRLALEQEMRFPHSVGMLYSAFTHYIGFKVNSGEYKLMGLAPYGEPRYVDTILEHLVRIGDDGSLWMDMSYFSYCHSMTMTSEKFHALFGGPPRAPEGRITQKEMDLAASIQEVCEDIVLRAARHAHRLTGLPNLVMAGGVALNCVANGELARRGPFERIWVQPAAGDAGGALGAALYHWHEVLGNSRRVSPSDSLSGSLLGPVYDDDDSALLLDSLCASYERFDDERGLVDRVAALLAEENVIGWFSGRMEYGPRALGSRSIIGDPRSARMQQTMNLKIKFRESFRPFAPSVLREHVHEVFEMRPEEDSPYMLFVAPVREEWRLELDTDSVEKLKDPDLTVRVSVPRSRIQAVTHVDYSARVQTVDELRHGRFYRLINRFFELSGCPVVVNTSFNIRGEPIVCTPEDAYRCFLATDMDYLVIGNLLLSKERQPIGLYPGLERYREQQPLD